MLEIPKETGWFATFKINGKPVRFLVDSGATCSFLDHGLWKTLNRRGSLTPVSDTFVMADGTPLGIEGRTSFDLRWGERDFPQDLIIAKLGENQAILGLDFIEKYRVALFLADGRMEIGNTQITLRKDGKNPGCARITAETTLTIADRSSAWINVGLDKELVATKEIQRDGFCVVEGLDTLAEDTGLFMANQLVAASGEKVRVLLLNVHDQPITIKKGMSLGKVYPVQSFEKLKDPSLNKSDNSTDSSPRSAGEMAGESSGSGGPLPTQILSNINQGDAEILLSKHDLPEHTQAVLKNTHELSSEQEAQVCELILEYKDCFKEPGGPNGRTDWEEHDMDVQGSKPIKQGYRPFPRAKQEVADVEVDRMLAEGIIEPSNSPWASPVVLVEKKDKSIRFCIDYRRVNEVTRKDAYPLPRITETLDTLSNAEWFCTMDLASGYWQINMKESAKPMTAFTTRKGFFQFNVMPFGLSNAPATFQRLMERVLMGLQWQVCLCYLDDIIVFGATFQETLARLRCVMDRLKAAGLKLKATKCDWFQHSVRYLGHVVSSQGVQCDPEKIAAVKDWPAPTTVTQVRGFIGFASYYRRFIPQFSEIAFPLTNLTRKSAKFQWSEECQQAFELLKQQLISAPILSYPISGASAGDGDYVLDTDASDHSVGAVLSQIQDGEERVIAYASRVLGTSKRNYCTTKKELFAVVLFVDHFKHYLSGRHFTVRTDHASLKWLRNFKNADGMLARWLAALECYDFNIIHRRGTQHGNADGMSRIPLLEPKRKCPRVDCKDCYRTVHQVSAIDSPSAGTWQADGEWLEPWTVDQLKDWQRADITLGQVVRWLERSPLRPAWREVEVATVPLKYYWTIWDTLRIDKGLLVRITKLPHGNSAPIKQIIAPQEIRRRVLQSLHGSPTGGHVGRNKLFGRVRQRFFWVGYKEDTARWCKRCDQCARAKPGPPRKRAGLGHKSVGAPLERIAIDIMGPLPVSESGNEYIMVVGDYYTKWTEAYAIKNHTALTVAENLVQRFISRFGVPHEFHSDQGREFESNLIKELCKLLHIRKTRTVPFNPKSDGMIERFNRTIKNLLRVMVNDAQNDWDDHLPYILMAYRASVHESTRCSPNLLMLGRETNLPVDLMLGDPPGSQPCPIGYVEWVRQATQYAFRVAETNLQSSAQRQKRLYDRNSGVPRIEVGETVWRLYPPKAKLKFGRGWQGPYLVVRKVNDLVYTIQTTRQSRRMNVHIDQLKKYEGLRPVQSWLQDGMSDSESESDEEGEEMETAGNDAVHSDPSTEDPPTEPILDAPSPQPGPSHVVRPLDDKDESLDSTIPYTYSMLDSSQNPDDNDIAVPINSPYTPLGATAAPLPADRWPTMGTEIPTGRRTARPRKPKLDPEYEYY